MNNGEVVFVHLSDLRVSCYKINEGLLMNTCVWDRHQNVLTEYTCEAQNNTFKIKWRL
jgi:hypothetical protein